MTFEDAESTSKALTAQKVSFGDDTLFIKPVLETMWGRYIRPGPDKSSRTPKHFRRANENPASNQLQPSISFSQPNHMAGGINLQPSVPFPTPKPNMRHRISGSLDTNRSGAAKEPRTFIPNASSNIRQHNQLDKDGTVKRKPSTPSMTDVTSINSHVVEMKERNSGAMTTMSQHMLYDTGDLNGDAPTLGSEADRLRNERDAAFIRADRLTEDFSLADQEIRRLYMNLSDLGTENSTLKWTIDSLEKELQLTQARLIDAQRQAPTNYPPYDSYIYHEDHAAELAEVQARYAREQRHLERLDEERKILLDDNQDLQRMIEGFKDAEIDLKRKLKSCRNDNEALRERLAAANKSARSESMLDQEIESKRNQIAHLTRGKEDAERALEQFKRAVNVGPELINAFSELEAMAGQGGNLIAPKRTPKGSNPIGSSGHLTHGCEDPSFPTAKRQRH